eukprot:TRINITY_DN17531_c0_g1_i1.p2 TRINITY_DN17531_c0_g1~~TRINITY_DN17531_c0_g1_i1.p2  ORF type:complete len:144 (-),score=33.60 TRINITY_DN17531_c0_g1_i1:332-706(-)
MGTWGSPPLQSSHPFHTGGLGTGTGASSGAAPPISRWGAASSQGASNQSFAAVIQASVPDPAVTPPPGTASSAATSAGAGFATLSPTVGLAGSASGMDAGGSGKKKKGGKKGVTLLMSTGSARG